MANDVKSGLSKAELVDKYSISARNATCVLKKLLQAAMITVPEF